MIIEAVTFTGNFGYSFSSEMCADFGHRDGEREEEESVLRKSSSYSLCCLKRLREGVLCQAHS